MSDKDTGTSDTVPEAHTRQRHGLSVIWLVPLAAILIAGWLGYRHFADKGPQVVITFPDAAGLEAGRTKVKFKDVVVGDVVRVQVSDDLKSVLVTAEMVPGFHPYMNNETRFWVVKPRVGTSGVSGLDTLVSGSYISVDPGKGGEEASAFKGLDEPPLLRFDVPGRRFVLESQNLSSINRGTPIYYKGFEVGQVLDYKLNEDRERFDIPIFIHAPYDEMVLEASRFWIESAVQVQAGSGGFGVKIGTLQSFLTGGITFDTPDFKTSERAGEKYQFTLYPDESSVGEARYTRSVPLLAYFDGSVRGLRPGAPVEIRGMKVGEVSDISLHLDEASKQITIPVVIEIHPQRINGDNAVRDDDAAYAELETLIGLGMRAQLKTASLITGDLYVDLVFERNAREASLDRSGDIPVMPTIPSDLDALEATVQQFVSRIEDLPLEKIAEDMRRTVEMIASRAGSPEIDQLLAEVQETARSIRRFTGDLADNSPPLMAELRETMRRVSQTAKNAQDVLDKDGGLPYDAGELMRELTQAARSVRVFAQYLERHPEALLRGKGGNFR
ncbi:MAG: MCE family protein [Geminicoccaceae bacterium]|nr:MCE family protein [Geminicoccaceae bacterium]MCB9945236.1 MCE family protein [Geminicoccaceae bacterium]